MMEISERTRVNKLHQKITEAINERTQKVLVDVIYADDFYGFKVKISDLNDCHHFEYHITLGFAEDSEMLPDFVDWLVGAAARSIGMQMFLR